MKIEGLTEEQQAQVDAMQKGLRITKVVATRAVKTKAGDFFVGMSAAWDTTQEDAGGMGADLISALSEEDSQQAAVTGGLTIRQARIAAYILGMQVDLQAGAHALGGGAISDAEFVGSAKAIRRKYARLIAGAVGGKVSSVSTEDEE